jgi:sugar phosphate isomerase/epimerase
MANAIVGYTGFVGSNLLKFYKFDYFYNSSNFSDAKNKKFDTIFFCGVPAVKWYSNKFPEEDFDVLKNIQNILGTIKAKKLILISTIDVYEYIESQQNEDYDCDFINNHTYGKNRYLFELFVKKTFDNHHIIRLPALYGLGLKKNIIYDLMNNNQIEKIERNTKFQWYNLDWLKNDIDIIIKNNIQICNLFTEPLETIEIIKLFDYDLDKYKSESKMTYNLKTKYSEIFGSPVEGYIRSKTETLSGIKDFLNFNKIDKSNLLVSNICVKHISQFQFACILKLFGIRNVQIAPTTLISWDNLNQINLDPFIKNAINIYSFQSITYGLVDNIFDDLSRGNLSKHIEKVIDCAIKYNLKVLVFGCPKNRKIINDIDMRENDKIFIDFFRRLGDYIGDRELYICIENNSKEYGCNYLNTISEVGEIVKVVNHKNIKMMVDIGNAIMEKDKLNSINNYFDLLYNIDIARENMKPFIEYNEKHEEFIKLIKENNYNKKINLEMITCAENFDEELTIIYNSIKNLINFTN